MTDNRDPFGNACSEAADHKSGWAGHQLRRAWMFLKEPPSREPAPSPFFDRFCIAVVSVDWIVFGSMHFSQHAATVRMIPGYIPWRDGVAVITGIAEVFVGMLTLYGRTRRTASIASLMLLTIYLLSVFNVASNDDALPTRDPTSLSSQLWRTLGVPHHALMLICSFHLARNPYPAPWSNEGNRTLKSGPTREDRGGLAAEGQGRGRPSNENGRSILLVALVLLLCNAAGLITIKIGVPVDRATAYMWMMMCLAVGGLLGFLFGVPRASGRKNKAPVQGGLRPNPNIEAISDWLTKILVGLGLVNFREVGTFLAGHANSLASTLQVTPSFTLALIIYFAVAGFLEGYLLTRMFLQGLFSETQRRQADQRDNVPTFPRSGGSAGGRRSTSVSGTPAKS